MDAPFRQSPLSRERILVEIAGVLGHKRGRGRARWRLHPDRLVEETRTLCGGARRSVPLGPGVRLFTSPPSRVGRATLVVESGPLSLVLHVDDGRAAQRFAATLRALIDGTLSVEPPSPLPFSVPAPLQAALASHAGHPPRAVELVGVAVHALLQGALLAMTLGVLGAIGAWGPFGDLVALLCLPASLCYLLAFIVVRSSELRLIGDGWRCVMPLGVTVEAPALFEIVGRAVARRD